MTAAKQAELEDAHREERKRNNRREPDAGRQDEETSRNRGEAHDDEGCLPIPKDLIRRNERPSPVTAHCPVDQQTPTMDKEAHTGTETNTRERRKKEQQEQREEAHVDREGKSSEER